MSPSVTLATSEVTKFQGLGYGIVFNIRNKNLVRRETSSDEISVCCYGAGFLAWKCPSSLVGDAIYCYPVCGRSEIQDFHYRFYSTRCVPLLTRQELLTKSRIPLLLI